MRLALSRDDSGASLKNSCISNALGGTEDNILEEHADTDNCVLKRSFRRPELLNEDVFAVAYLICFSPVFFF